MLFYSVQQISIAKEKGGLERCIELCVFYLFIFVEFHGGGSINQVSSAFLNILCVVVLLLSGKWVSGFISTLFSLERAFCEGKRSCLQCMSWVMFVSVRLRLLRFLKLPPFQRA